MKDFNLIKKIVILCVFIKRNKIYQGMFEAAKRNTRSSLFAKPSICTSSSVFILLLPSCSLELIEINQNLKQKKY
jgi:hypothetical protein